MGKSIGVKINCILLVVCIICGSGIFLVASRINEIDDIT